MRAEFLTLDIQANNSAEDDLKQLRRDLDKVDDETNEFRRGQKRTEDTVRKTKEEIKREAEELRELRRRLNAAATASSRAGGGFGRSASSLLRGASAAGKFGIAAAGVAEAFNLIGVAADAAGRAVEIQARLLKDSIQTAAEFEQEITRVTALVGGSAQEFALLRRAASEGGQSTLFSAQEAGEALRFLAQAGFDARQSAAALPGTLQLAGAGMLELGAAADIATNVLTGYGLKVEDIGRVNDILVKASSTSNTNVRELGNAFSYTAGLADSTSQEIENITALFSLLANAGIKSTRAGRSVAMAIQRIAKPTAEGAAALAKFNVETVDSEGKVRELTDILRELEAGGAQARDIIAIFGAVAGRSLITVLEQGTGRLDSFAASFSNANGSAAEFQRTLQDTASAQVRIFQSTLETLSIEVGQRFTPALKEGAKVLSENASELANNSEFLDQFEVIAVDATAAARELLLVTAELVPVLTVLGGVTLETAKNARLLALGFKQAGRVALATSGNFQLAAEGLTDDLVRGYELAEEASGDFGDSLEASIKIGQELRSSLIKSASGIETLERNMRLGASTSYGFEDAIDGVKKGIVALGLADTRSGVEKLQDFWDGLGTSVENAEAAVKRFYSTISTAPPPPPVLAFPEPEVPEGSTKEREAQLDIARIQLRIAKSTDEIERARLGAAIKFRELKVRETDEDIAALERQRIWAELENEIEGIRKRRKPRGPTSEELAFINEQARLELRILEATDERQRIELTALSKRQAIAEQVRKKELTSAQALTARTRVAIETEEAIDELAKRRAREQEEADRKRLDARRAEFELRSRTLDQELEIARLQGASPERLRQLALEARYAQIAASSVSEQEKIRARLIARLESENAARKEATDTQQRLLDLESKRLRVSGTTTDQVLARELEFQRELIRISQATLTDEERRAELALARAESERDIAEILREQQRAQAALVGSTIGAAANTSGIQAALGDDFTRSEASRQAEIEQLRRQREEAGNGGASTEFLERRIELLEREGELEQRNQELIQQRLQTISQLGTELGTLTEATLNLAASAERSQEAYESQAAALGAATQLAGTLTGAFVKDLKRRAQLNAIFNAAAATAALAGYFTSAGTAGHLLSAAIKHGAAAVQFGVVAGTASAGSGSGGGFGGGAAANAASSGSASNVVDLDSERVRSAEYLANAIAARFEQPTETVYNFYMSGPMLANAPDTARELKRVVDDAGANVVTASVSA